MNVKWTLARLSKRAQAAQVERMVTMCEAPKNGMVANIKGGNQDRPTTGHAMKPLHRRFEASDIVSNVTRKSKISWLIHQRKYQIAHCRETYVHHG